MSTFSQGPPAANTSRQPTAIVKLNGSVLPGIISVKTTNVTHNSSDSFTVELALQVQGSNADFKAWSGTNTKPEIEIIYGLLAPDGSVSAQSSAIIGPVDHVEIDSDKYTAVITGRDYSSVLIDAQTFQNYTNQTSSQIVSSLATQFGLTPMVQATTTKVGRLDNETQNYSRVTRRESVWDLITTLARNEGFVAYVIGKNLYFQPDTLPSDNPYKLIYIPPPMPGQMSNSNVTKIKMARALTLAKDIFVTVTSHDADKAVSTQATAHATLNSSGNGSAMSNPSRYTVDIPGLTEAQCQVRAKQMLNQVSLFERVLHVDMPGDTLLTFSQPVTLTGTNTDYDQTYFMDQLDKSLSMEAGFRMNFRCKNHSSSQNQKLTES